MTVENNIPNIELDDGIQKLLLIARGTCPYKKVNQCVAAVVFSILVGGNTSEVSTKANVAIETAKRWVSNYKKKGLDGISFTARVRNNKILKNIIVYNEDETKSDVISTAKSNAVELNVLDTYSDDLSHIPEIDLFKLIYRTFTEKANNVIETIDSLSGEKKESARLKALKLHAIAKLSLDIL